MKLRPIKNNIIFKFVDEVDSKGQFVETTKWGLIISSSHSNSAQSPRWANVVEVGPECEHVNVGQQILIRALKWTSHFKLNGEKCWKTDEKQVVAVRDSETSELKILGTNIVFAGKKEDKNKFTLAVIGSMGDTASGEVVSIGDDVVEELKNSTIFYSETNFFEHFEHNNETLNFISEDEILAYVPAE